MTSHQFDINGMFAVWLWLVESELPYPQGLRITKPMRYEAVNGDSKSWIGPKLFRNCCGQYAVFEAGGRRLKYVIVIWIYQLGKIWQNNPQKISKTATFNVCLSTAYLSRPWEKIVVHRGNVQPFWAKVCLSTVYLSRRWKLLFLRVVEKLRFLRVIFHWKVCGFWGLFSLGLLKYSVLKRTLKSCCFGGLFSIEKLLCLRVISPRLIMIHAMLPWFLLNLQVFKYALDIVCFSLASHASCAGSLGWPGQFSQIWKLCYFVRFRLRHRSKIHRSNLAWQSDAKFILKRLVWREMQAQAQVIWWWVTCHGSIRYPPST